MARQDGRDAADQNFDYMFKLLIIGNSSVGKTSFLFRYADDSFTSAFVSTVGIDFKVKTVFRHDKRVKLQIWVSIIILCTYNILTKSFAKLCVMMLTFFNIHVCIKIVTCCITNIYFDLFLNILICFKYF